jgi:hypothetical protein
MKPIVNYGLSDSLIDAVRKAVEEAKLHPNQQKLDVHEPEKDELTSQDFKKLRAGKKVKDGIDTKPKLKEEEEIDEAHRRGGNRFLNTREKDAIQKKMKPLDPNAPVEYKDKHSITRGLPHEEQLIRHIHAATGHHVYISPFTHDMHPHDSKEVITKEVYNTGGKGTYGGPGGTKHTPNSLVQAVKKFHNKKLRAEEVEEIDETEEQMDEAPMKSGAQSRREVDSFMDQYGLGSKQKEAPKSNIRKVVGKSYGADYKDPEGEDETAADMKKPEPKRKSGPQGTMARRFNTKSYDKIKGKLKAQY